MAGVAGRSGSGGARPGSGRKSKAEKFARPIAAAEKRIADRLPELIENQFTLAFGGGQRTEEHWKPAGTIMIDGIARDKDGNPVIGPRGGVTKAKVPAFPDLPPEQLVLVERKVIVDGPDRAANEYLIDRILGKPTQAIEAEITGPGGGAIPVAIEQAISKVYGDSDTGSSREGDQ